MARIDDIERRLLNWARWRLGPSIGGLGYSSVTYSEEAGQQGYREATIPTVDCEAEETDQAVKALPAELCVTVEVFYLGAKGVEAKARRLGCSVATLYARIGQAHPRMQAWFADLHLQRRRQRERVEQLQRTARPADG